MKCGSLLKPLLLSSAFPTRGPLCSLPVFLSASWDQELNRWLHLRHWLRNRNRKDSPSPPPPCQAELREPAEQAWSPQPPNLTRESGEYPLPVLLTVPMYCYTRLKAASDYHRERRVLDHRLPGEMLKTKSSSSFYVMNAYKVPGLEFNSLHKSSLILSSWDMLILTRVLEMGKWRL